MPPPCSPSRHRGHPSRLRRSPLSPPAAGANSACSSRPLESIPRPSYSPRLHELKKYYSLQDASPSSQLVQEVESQAYDEPFLQLVSFSSTRQLVSLSPPFFTKMTRSTNLSIMLCFEVDTVSAW